MPFLILPCPALPCIGSAASHSISRLKVCCLPSPALPCFALPCPAPALPRHAPYQPSPALPCNVLATLTPSTDSKSAVFLHKLCPAPCCPALPCPYQPCPALHVSNPHTTNGLSSFTGPTLPHSALPCFTALPLPYPCPALCVRFRNAPASGNDCPSRLHSC